MAEDVFVSLILLIPQVTVLALLVAVTIGMIRRTGSITAVFLVFCLTLWLFSDLYWVIYDNMFPEIRMPFAANEIGEFSMFLMLAATINSASARKLRSLPIMIGAAVFGGCNVVFWGLWSGEWLQDIVIGLVFTWVIYAAANSLKSSHALARWEWRTLGVLCTLALGAQALTFVLDEDGAAVSELVGYILLAVGAACMAAELIRAVRSKAAPRVLFALSSAAMVWMLTAKYLTDGYWYNAFLLLETLSIICWVLSARRVVNES